MWLIKNDKNWFFFTLLRPSGGLLVGLPIGTSVAGGETRWRGWLSPSDGLDGGTLCGGFVGRGITFDFIAEPEGNFEEQ